MKKGQSKEEAEFESRISKLQLLYAVVAWVEVQCLAEEWLRRAAQDLRDLLGDAIKDEMGKIGIVEARSK